MKIFALEAKSRADVGKGASRRLRHADLFPAVLYGVNIKPQSLSMNHSAILKLIDDEAFYTSILSIKIDGKDNKAVVKDIQRHAYKPKILHMDFQQVRDDQLIHMQVPIHFIGAENAPCAKLGGQITHLMSSIEVSCMAKDLPEFVEIDVSGLNIGDTLHISDLKLPEGVVSVELSHGKDHDQPIVAAQKTRAMKGEGESEETAGSTPV